MAVYCTLCNRTFGSAKALTQHEQGSPAHAFNCIDCDRSFSSGGALQQHLQYSPAHAPSFDCVECNRSFNSNEALQQHMRDASAHAPSFDCADCDRSFNSDQALQQHLQYSPAHAPSFDCADCNRSFSSDDALQQHLRDSPAHVPSFDCEPCARSFSSEEALEQHLRDSPTHQQPPRSPLDLFFLSFRTFEYDPSQPPATSYARLRRHEGWRRDETASKDAWNRYQEALEDELRMWYGSEDSLTAWHALCRAIGIEPLPQTCEQCMRAVRKTHVNIVDLIEWGRRRGDTGEAVRTFGNLNELQDYTRETRKIFRNTFCQEGGNVVMRHLLRKIF